MPNILTKKLFDEKSGTFVKVKLSARALRTLAKNPKKYVNEIHAVAKKAQKKSLKRAQK